MDGYDSRKGVKLAKQTHSFQKSLNTALHLKSQRPKTKGLPIQIFVSPFS
jgi:hypothetical protein